MSTADVHAHEHPAVALPAPASKVDPTVRADAVRRARWLNRITIAWNAVEGVVAIGAGLAAGSVSLVGFGVDSGIEVSAAVVLWWRLRQEQRGGCMQEADARATRAIAASFAALAAYVLVEAVTDLRTAHAPEPSSVGVALAFTSLLLMPALARAKVRLAPVLGSAAAKADAAQTNLCALLSAVVLVGVGANWWLGWWWADPVAGVGIAGLAAAEAVRTWRADSLADTCCA
jgi:divalent metal cation (Fe/Co/Zn/Cd) transporter